MIPVTPADIITHPSTRRQGWLGSTRELIRERALRLKYGTSEVFRVVLGGQMGLDLSEEVCSCCGGMFPRTGYALRYVDQHGTVLYLHEGDYREIDAWAEDFGCEEPA